MCEMIKLGGENFTLVWTRHAANRVAMRGAVNEQMANCMLKLALMRAEDELSKELSTVDGFLDLYDKMSNIVAIMNLNRKRRKLYVITYGDTDSMYPQYGDLTIQIDVHGHIRMRKWKFQKWEPIPTDVYCRLNGRTLRLRWTKGCAKIVLNQELKKVREDRLRSIADKISNSLRHIPEKKIVNIWDWRFETFISVAIDEDYLDVILYNTTNFVEKCGNKYARVDITATNCEMRQAG